MSIPEHECVHYAEIRGGTHDLTGAVIRVTRPARGRAQTFVVQEVVSDDGETKTYSMLPVEER